MKTISERALEKFLASRENPDAFLAIKCLSHACDEWQASVEDRLASIGLGIVPGTCQEVVLAQGTAKPK